VVALSVAVAGTYAFTPPFWAIASSTMSGIAAAAAIGIVSAIGNFGGFVAPSIMGYLRDLTGSFASGQIAIACMAFAGALLLLLIARWRKVSGVGGEAII
jgi:ACS family tartrate transporter-like MFS transporter